MNVKKLLGCYLVVAALGPDYHNAFRLRWNYDTKFRTKIQESLQIPNSKLQISEPPRWVVQTTAEICQILAAFTLYLGLKLIAPKKGRLSVR